MKASTFILLGLVFAALWASASAAVKIGLRTAEPLVLFNLRFILAGVLLLAYAYAVERQPFPTRREWRQLLVFSLFNTVLYLTLFVFALKEVAAGIGSLSTAINPLLISILSAAYMRRRVTGREWGAIVLGMAGVGIATYPLLLNSYTTPRGLVFMGGSLLAYSVATLYYSTCTWTLSRPAINGWQTVLAAGMILPLTLAFYQGKTQFDATFWFSELWLVVPVSIAAVQLWLRLLKADAVRASFFLFLCPIFGFTYATLLLDEPFTVYTLMGTVFVLAGLYLGQRKT